MITDRFHQLRKEELDKAFSKKNISNIWRKIVRQQLRKADILDIFDYYDFNYSIDSKALLIRSDLLNGNYVCSKPLVYRLEKKYGICRHMILPQPIDALILQIITNQIDDEVLKNQPSKNAFYSRDKHSIQKPHEIDEYGYNWIQLWKKMQKKIYKFKDEKNLVVVTDLSNYYDSIYIPELRKIITGYVDKKETLLDILFKIIENITWLPDYLPYTGRNLPTTNLEAVRLLAHSFLFEFDNISKLKSNDSFTRWMDDIVIGVNTRKEAIETLSSASDVLKSRGLALNLRKTNIYNASEAEFHFLINENKYLDSIDIKYHLENGISTITKDLGKKLKNHLKNNTGAKYYEKITKRYITTFARLSSKKILSQVPELFDKNPGIRQNLLYYLTNIGYSKQTSKVVIQILKQLNLFDDISLFNISKLITDWKVPLNTHGDLFIEKVIQLVLSFSTKRKNSFDFYCVIWLMTKYSHPDDLYRFIQTKEYIWKSTPFLRRQITSVLSRLLPYKEDKVKKILQHQIATSESQVVSVANSLLLFQSLDKVESKVKMYLFPQSDSQMKIYPLSKFLVLCSFLNSDVYKNDKDVQDKIRNYIKDPYYKKWIDFQYNIK